MRKVSGFSLAYFYELNMIFSGAWLIHVVLVFMGKIIIDTIPGMTQQISWTLVNLIYLNVSIK